jgi:hypothetical protein
MILPQLASLFSISFMMLLKVTNPSITAFAGRPMTLFKASENILVYHSWLNENLGHRAEKAQIFPERMKMRMVKDRSEKK